MTEPEQPTAESGTGTAQSAPSAADPKSAPIPPGQPQQPPSQEPLSPPPGGPQPQPPYGTQAQPPYGPGPGPQWQYGSGPQGQYGQQYGHQYGPPPGYQPPYYGYGYPQLQSGTNGMAIAAMVCGICGFLCLIPGVVGIILGGVSLPQIKRSGQAGRGMAIAGMVTGVLWIVAFILLIVFSNHTSQPVGTTGTGNGTSM